MHPQFSSTIGVHTLAHEGIRYKTLLEIPYHFANDYKFANTKNI
jgi:hypothetical protein